MTTQNPTHSLNQPKTCGNCEAILTGPYCAQCGQHAHTSARNLAAVIHDLWHDVTHLDGRLWHTLVLLLIQPGRLTADYFQEKRARYLPPVRLYLVLSLIFFSFTLSNPSSETHSDTKQAPVDISTPGGSCQMSPTGFGLVDQAFKTVCAKIEPDQGSSFSKLLIHNIPKMMFVFLPVLAVFMLLLYHRPKRYYVEHLIYLLHNHCAVFLAFSLVTLLGLLSKLWSPLGVLEDAWALLVPFYLAWYPYKSLRRYYGQSRRLTAFKYILLAGAYTACLVLTLLGTAVLTALEG